MAFDAWQAIHDGDCAAALGMVIAGPAAAGVQVSGAERDELAAMLEAAGQPAEAAAGLNVGQPDAGVP